MDWIDKQRSEHEPQHQWELKRKFMKKNKDKFSKDELCGLAQTMGNIEFMGCRYPRDTHRRIAELSVGIIEEYRERKKGKLQRTFVKASDAAEGKVNRNAKKRSNTDEGSTAENEPVRKSPKVLKYGMFVSSAAKDEDEDQDENKLEAGIYAPKNKQNEDFMGFSGRGFGFKDESNEDNDDLSDSSLLQCGLCKEICKRGAKTDCCSARACRACATKEVTKSRSCWSCNALGLSSDNLVNDELLRAAVDHFKTHDVLLPEHRIGLGKKVKTFENEPPQKPLKYGNFVSSSAKDEDDVKEPNNEVNQPSEDFMGFCNQVISDTARGFGSKDSSKTTSNSLKYGNFVTSSKDEDKVYFPTNFLDKSSMSTDSQSDSSLLQCGLCKEICKRGAKTDCCAARACRSCATKELTKSRSCWSCNALGINSDNLVNDDLLRTAVEYYKTHNTLLTEHRNGLKKKVEAPSFQTILAEAKKTPISPPKVKSFPTAPSKPPPFRKNEDYKRQNNSYSNNQQNYKGQNNSYSNNQQNYKEQNSSYWNNQQPRVQLNLDYNYPLHNFILVLLDYMNDEHPANIISRSGSFCKMITDFEYKSGPRNNVTCVVKIANNVVCEFSATTKQGARDRALENAINILQQHCYTIKIKNKYLSDGTTVDLMEVEVNTAVGGNKSALGSENVGHKLLGLMGWSGGGLGKEGGGISEPITANYVFGREGLGTTGVLKNFKEKITKIMEEYIHSSNPHDLVFTTGFDNGQRAEMHKIARRLGLKSKSFGKKDDRFLTITRKMNGVRLLEDLIQQGGSTEKYTVLEPREADAYTFSSSFT